MNPRQASKIFFHRKTIIITVFVASVISAFGVAHLLKPQYVATTQLYFNLVDPNGATNALVPGAVVRNYIATQVEAIKSRGTALMVVEREGLAANPGWQAAYQAAAENGDQLNDWIAAALLRSLDVARQSSSDIIAVSFRSEGAETSAKIANAFAEAFLRKDVELRTMPAQELAKWYDERLQLLRGRFLEVETQRSQLRLEAIRRGDVDATGTPDPLTSLPTVLATARASVIQAKGALELARSGQAPPPENPELLALRRQVTDVELALRRELPLLGEGHRRISNLRTNLRQLQTQIDTATARLRVELVAEKERELGAAERRVEEATALISRDETQRHDQVKSRASAVSLDRELESLRTQIEALVQRRERSIVEGAATQSNISVLSRASVPLSPNWPRVPLIIAIAGALGLAFGFILAFLREMLDRRVRCVDDLTDYFEVPLLGEITGERLSSKMAPLPSARDRLAPSSRRDGSWMIEAATA